MEFYFPYIEELTKNTSSWDQSTSLLEEFGITLHEHVGNAKLNSNNESTNYGSTTSERKNTCDSSSDLDQDPLYNINQDEISKILDSDEEKESQTLKEKSVNEWTKPIKKKSKQDCNQKRVTLENQKQETRSNNTNNNKVFFDDQSNNKQRKFLNKNSKPFESKTEVEEDFLQKLQTTTRVMSEPLLRDIELQCTKCFGPQCKNKICNPGHLCHSHLICIAPYLEVISDIERKTNEAQALDFNTHETLRHADDFWNFDIQKLYKDIEKYVEC